MPALIIRHKVADFDTWLKAFEAHAAERKAAGATKSIVWRDADDPNSIVALIKVDDLDRARAFAASAELQQAMQAAGVVGPPTVFFLGDSLKFEN